jgi:DNA replication and repair protein RecF
VSVDSAPRFYPAPDRVALTALSLKDLRNYADLSVRFAPGVITLTGPNGAGKTNLLEAISLLTPGRGLRRATFEEIVRHGAARWAVAATIERNGAEDRIGAGLVEAAPGETAVRKVRINRAPADSAETLLDYLRVLWLTPAMDGLFTGAAGDRRRFLDRLVLTIDPSHGRRARDLERLLTQRNRLLEERAAATWLDAIEIELAERAVAVALARAETAALLSARLSREEGGFPGGRMHVAGEFDAAIAGRAATEAETWFRGALAEMRAADRAARRALLGPHRSDLEVLFAAKDTPAAHSSTGEQKALLIGIVLAHAKLVAETSGMNPVLLLDEAAAHLDPERRRALFHRLDALGCQTFMTGTDRTLFSGLTASTLALQVIDGKVMPANPSEKT